MLINALEECKINNTNVGVKRSQARSVGFTQLEIKEINVGFQAVGVGALGNDRNSEFDEISQKDLSRAFAETRGDADNFWILQEVRQNSPTMMKFKSVKIATKTDKQTH